MADHTPLPWTVHKESEHGIYPIWAKCGPLHVQPATAHGIADAELIVTAVNNHAPMVKTLGHCVQLFDTLAKTMDRWANDSMEGGWSTDQVDENLKRAADCRRYAAQIRSALSSAPVGGARD